MRIPFFDRFVSKSKSFYEMEEITDKALREYLRNPQKDSIQIGEAIYADEQKTSLVIEALEHTLPVFCDIANRIQKEESDEQIAGETGVILPYIRQLRQIVRRQQLEYAKD